MRAIYLYILNSIFRKKKRQKLLCRNIDFIVLKIIPLMTTSRELMPKEYMNITQNSYSSERHTNYVLPIIYTIRSFLEFLKTKFWTMLKLLLTIRLLKTKF